MPSHRFESTYKRNNTIATNGPGIKSFIERFVGSDGIRSKMVKSLQRQLTGKQPDGISNELNLQLSLAMAVDVGCHITTATYILEGDNFLVRMCVDVWAWA